MNDQKTIDISSAKELISKADSVRLIKMDLGKDLYRMQIKVGATKYILEASLKEHLLLIGTEVHSKLEIEVVTPSAYKKAGAAAEEYKNWIGKLISDSKNGVKNKVKKALFKTSTYKRTMAAAMDMLKDPEFQSRLVDELSARKKEVKVED